MQCSAVVVDFGRVATAPNAVPKLDAKCVRHERRQLTWRVVHFTWASIHPGFALFRERVLLQERSQAGLLVFRALKVANAVGVEQKGAGQEVAFCTAFDDESIGAIGFAGRSIRPFAARGIAAHIVAVLGLIEFDRGFLCAANDKKNRREN